VTIVVAGGTGFLGRALVDQLAAAGHRVLTLTRTPRQGRANDVAWTPDGTAGAWGTSLEAADAVINLAGEGIGDRRWTTAQKARLRDSRILAVRSLAAAMRANRTPPPVFVGASAVGYYGAHGDEPVTEQTPPGSDFLAGVCVEWERESTSISSASTRVALIRTGLVLHPHGGALEKMLLPFRMGVGGKFGSGRQFMPWIHRQDWINLVTWILERGDAAGPFNLSAPVPVTNADFTRALARALNRPAFLPVPAFALRVALGEMADGLLLTGQRALPARAEQLGFAFTFRELGAALDDLL
jgi:uncharacterized protein (TIGR01777 family)